MIKLKIALSVIAFEVLLSLETVLFRFSYYFDTYFDDENKLIPENISNWDHRYHGRQRRCSPYQKWSHHAPEMRTLLSLPC